MASAKSKKRDDQVLAMVYGKVAPQAPEVEKCILGAIMIEKDGMDKVTELLRPEVFYLEAHQRIYMAMEDLRHNNFPIDIQSTVEQLRQRGDLELVGGPFYVTQLTNWVVNSANIEHHCRIVIERFIKRENIRIGGLCVQLGYEDTSDVFDMRDQIEQEWTGLYNKSVRRKYVSIDQSVVDVIQQIEKKRHESKKITGVPAGFADLDRITHGWQSTDLIILAARPSVGKTALSLNFAINAAHSIPVGFCSLEMSTAQLTSRMLASESGLHLERILHGYFDDAGMEELYTSGVQKVAKLPIYIDDSHHLNIYELKSMARNWKRKHDIGILIIDYLQLMAGMQDDQVKNRNEEISKIMRDLKGLAKELNIPIIALSQLSREVEKRKGHKSKMPWLSDLRDSGSIEQDADLVMFLYRPEYYDDNADKEGVADSGESHLRIAKHRNGKLDTVKLKARLEIQKFLNWDALDDVKPFIGSGNWRPVKEEEKTDDLPF